MAKIRCSVSSHADILYLLSHKVTITNRSKISELNTFPSVEQMWAFYWQIKAEILFSCYCIIRCLKYRNFVPKNRISLPIFKYLTRRLTLSFGDFWKSSDNLDEQFFTEQNQQEKIHNGDYGHELFISI